MVDATHISFRADDRSYFSLLKKEIHSRVSEAGFGTQKSAEIDIIVSEMTSNLFKYAIDGEILLSYGQENSIDYFEIISIDNGPGMSDAAKMVADGVSTTNTLGHGLGSIKRLSDKFEIYSQKGWGTIALSRVYRESPGLKKRPPVELRRLVVSKPGESVSGDGCYYEMDANKVRILVADGLGHGIEANKAVNEAIKAFKELNSDDPSDIIKQLHSSIKKTRGMVGTVIIYDIKSKTWKFAGIGNISMKLLNSLSSKNYISYNGIIGHNIPTTIKPQEATHLEYNQMILCSDGIKSRWESSKYPLINKYDLSILAAALYKDYARRTDDMSVVIARSF
ncbi:SpoIIE family protein phosphatase [Desertivirga brevis]|uniref:SpoIIE family protein phosphatase n=1 Tax=Desertivirga brevis TaxID=2810310 RepID=UPI001A9681E7|nr:SpoIIE family protein phosphatase [Pedobacter sp. SYSU D00873]